MIRKMLVAAATLAMLAGTASIAAPCKDAKGKFMKCPPAKPAPAARCRLKGKFVKCGTPGATPA